MRGSGGGGAPAEESDPLLRRPDERNPAELAALRRGHGRWLKFLGANGCYLYVHGLTREVAKAYTESVSQ